MVKNSNDRLYQYTERQSHTNPAEIECGEMFKLIQMVMTRTKL